MVKANTDFYVTLLPSHDLLKHLELELPEQPAPAGRPELPTDEAFCDRWNEDGGSDAEDHLGVWSWSGGLLALIGLFEDV